MFQDQVIRPKRKHKTPPLPLNVYMFLGKEQTPEMKQHIY